MTPLALPLQLSASVLGVERAVEQGSQLLRQGRSHVGALIAKGDRDFATAVDLEVEATVQAALRDVTPDIPFLGEEHPGGEIGTGPIWVLDPIDGTVNFARGSPLCGISLALLENGRPRLAVIDLPFMAERYLAVEGAGAYLNGRRIHCSPVPWLHEAVVGLSDFSVGRDAPTENPLHLALLQRLASARRPSISRGRQRAGWEPRSCSRTFRGTSAAAFCLCARPAAWLSISTEPTTPPAPAARSPAHAASSSRSSS